MLAYPKTRVCRVNFSTADGTAAATQVDDYYPFSMEISRTPPTPVLKNEYLYNKKELQEELQQYDYGARFYDPVIGRWTSVDKLAEHPDQIDKSPYAYVWDNPVVHDDPDGNCPICVVAELVAEVYEAATATEVVATVSVVAVGAVSMHHLHDMHISNPVMQRDAIPNSSTVPQRPAIIQSNSNAKNLDEPKTSTQARKDVMRKEGIPTSQQPTSQKKSPAGNSLEYDVPKSGGGTQKKVVQDQKMDENHGPHWEAGKPKANGQTDPSGRPRLQNGKSKTNYNE
ncbi:MAG TPA: RHS repeat-associated core domain-containing protein [Mucilaginibacter sp.]|nr:RHS repeat-associated core domain-containing protein [Mucilaginibacter sp.]